MKLMLSKLEQGAALLALLGLMSGCATPALWAKRPYRPAANPKIQLALANDRNDVLVCYDEVSGSSVKTCRRAYWLFAYSSRSACHPKPKFINPDVAAQLQPLPIFEVGGTNLQSSASDCAFALAGSRGFKLQLDGRPVGEFWLPLYESAAPATFWRVALTAPAVAADTAIICAAVYAGGGAACAAR